MAKREGLVGRSKSDGMRRLRSSSIRCFKYIDSDANTRVNDAKAPAMCSDLLRS